MRLIVASSVLWLAACGAASTSVVPHDDELERAIVFLERDVALAPTPIALALLSLATERAGHADRAREVLSSLEGDLPEMLAAELPALRVRLEAEASGEGYRADPALRARVLEWTHRLEEHRERLRAGTVDGPR